MSLVWSQQQTKRIVRPTIFVANAILKRRCHLLSIRRTNDAQLWIGWKATTTGGGPQWWKLQQNQPRRSRKMLWFSSVVTAPPSPAASSSSNSNKSNIFLDNLGTVFLGAIVTVIVWLVRSYYNGQARNKLRDGIEQEVHADPIEIDDLRTANTEMNVDLFLEIYAHVRAETEQQESPELRYDQFVALVREVMARKLGTAAFTVQLGHLLDRVAAAALAKRGKSLSSSTTDNGDVASVVSNDGDETTTNTTTMPMMFWFTLLSLSLSSPPHERIDALYAILSEQGQRVPTLQDVTELVGYLQDTCQLVPDAQVVATTHQYPLQQYAIASPVQLVDRYRVQYKIADDDETLDKVDNDRLLEMLTSNSICVWGECYKKKNKRPARDPPKEA
jgi:hypothetical protein